MFDRDRNRIYALAYDATGQPSLVVIDSDTLQFVSRTPGLDIGLQMSFGASGVPPGRYYVRVRSGNYAGLSDPSNEVVVRVP